MRDPTFCRKQIWPAATPLMILASLFNRTSYQVHRSQEIQETLLKRYFLDTSYGLFGQSRTFVASALENEYLFEHIAERCEPQTTVK